MKSIVRIVSVVFVFSSAIFSSQSFGKDIGSHELKKESKGVESLSPELRALLTEEMLALQNGMMSIIPAYASGDWSVIESVGLKMKNSYIMKQRLTDKQKQELHTSLPDSFFSQDRQFHYLAGMLSHAAKNKKAELVGFYFSKLNEACISCHTQYATQRFPALAQPNKTYEHSQ